MTVIIFPKGTEQTPSSRQRAYVISEELAKRGVASRTEPLTNIELSTTPWPAKLGLLKAAAQTLLVIRKEDVIYLQRTIYNKYFLVMVCLNKLIFRQRIIFDFDDAIFLHSPLKTAILTRLADHVTVGSHYLYDWAKRHNSHVSLIPTAIEFDRFKDIEPDYGQKDVFTIGFTGNGPVYFSALQRFVPVLERLTKKGYKLRFVLAGTFGNAEINRYFQRLDGPEIVLIDRLPYHEIPKLIGSFDVGIMPLLSNEEWNKGKCALKALEYMACGVVAIASRIGENTFVIKDEIDGLLADTEDEWVEKLTRIMDDCAFRKNVGQAGRLKVKNFYSFQAIMPKLIEILEPKRLDQTAF